MKHPALAAMILAVAAAEPAAAHAPGLGGTGIVGGLLHPVLVPAHVLVLVGLGLVAGQQERGRSALLAMFTVGLVAGLAAIALAAGPSSAPLVLALVTIVAGAWTAAARPLPALVGWPLMSVAGAALGLDSPPEVVDLTIATLMLIGTGFGAVIVLTAVVEASALLRRDWQRVGVRIVGSWTAAAATLVLALALAR